MKSIIIRISLAFFLVLISATYSHCNAHDKKALLKIKESFGNPDELSNWNPNNDCCNFSGVGCGSNRVVEVRIIFSRASGQIPSEVGDLTYLKTLSLTDHSKLTGPIQPVSNLTRPIQPAIAKLKNLVKLTLSGLQLTGSVPSFLGQLKSLTTLDLSNNYLSGSIPSALSQLTSIYTLLLHNNKLTGTIPDTFGTLKLDEINLSNNQLSGKIPTSLGKMSFFHLDLSGNKLEGDASMLLFSSNTELYYELFLSRNLLEFNMSKVRISNKVTKLDLSHNKVYGSIPSQMNQMTALWFLDLSYNRLCGQIPQGRTLQIFDRRSYFHNPCLCGSPLDSCK